jgi:hypothetical protein
VAYQILHRCAAAVIEAQRYGIAHAVFVVQAFNSPPTSYAEFETFCHAIGVAPERGRLLSQTVGGIELGVAWIDFPFATDAQLVRLNVAGPAELPPV